MDEKKLLDRITVNPKIFGGKPIIRGHRLAVEHVLGMLAAGDSVETKFSKATPGLSLRICRPVLPTLIASSGMRELSLWRSKLRQRHEATAR
jgi:hypothetical protein